MSPPNLPIGLASIDLKLKMVDDQADLLARPNKDLLDVLVIASKFAEADPRDESLCSPGQDRQETRSLTIFKRVPQYKLTTPNQSLRYTKR